MPILRRSLPLALISVLFAVSAQAQQTCGNLTCEQGEDASNCPSDCTAAPICGDLVCDASVGEDAQSCPYDCGPAAPVCGNNSCEAGEDISPALPTAGLRGRSAAIARARRVRTRTHVQPTAAAAQATFAETTFVPRTSSRAVIACRTAPAGWRERPATRAPTRGFARTCAATAFAALERTRAIALKTARFSAATRFARSGNPARPTVPVAAMVSAIPALAKTTSPAPRTARQGTYAPQTVFATRARGKTS